MAPPLGVHGIFCPGVHCNDEPASYWPDFPKVFQILVEYFPFKNLALFVWADDGASEFGRGVVLSDKPKCDWVHLESHLSGTGIQSTDFCYLIGLLLNVDVEQVYHCLSLCPRNPCDHVLRTIFKRNRMRVSQYTSAYTYSDFLLLHSLLCHCVSSEETIKRENLRQKMLYPCVNAKL